MSTITITDAAIASIERFALDAFHKRPSFQALSAKEIQIYCIIEGLANHIHAQGGTPGYTLQGFVQEDSLSVEDVPTEADPDPRLEPPATS